MEIYKTPSIELIEILSEGLVMTGSTNEKYDAEDNYDGIWS